jgi:3-deoxy-D-manno-octulosonate 8-phosphate phosphatase (KDO 8-P phosphatase)
MVASDSDLAVRCALIDLLLIDVDGVLTDGVIAIDDNGIETRHFHVRDGSGIHLWRKAGKRTAILSGRSAPCVNLRAAELGITPVLQGTPQKSEPFQNLLRELDLNARQVCYVGDDLPDLPVLTAVGLAACPADAAPEVQKVAHFITSSTGGRGVVREVVELVLKHQGAWHALISAYDNPA